MDLDRSPIDRPDSANDADALLKALRVLRERWWLILLCVLACAGIAFGLSITRDEVYRSTASVLFGQSQLSDSAFGIQRESAEPERDAATQVLVATSSEVTNRAGLSLRTRESRADLADRITVEAADNANVLEFEADGETPREAAAVANAFARSYVDFTRESQTQRLDDQIDALERQLAAVPVGADRSALEQRLGTLQSLRSAASGEARLIGAAEGPREPSSPQPVRDAILGGLFGLILGVALVFVIDLFDRRIRSVEEFEQIYRMRALAAIPQIAFAPRRQEDWVVGFEPYRMLRNSLGFVEMTRTLDVLMVTSAVPAEGKSTVATHLARAMALTGERVVLVECDLRRPSLARDLGIRNPTGGLTTALIRRRPVAELLQPFDSQFPNLTLLSSGPLPPNAAELLRSPRMGEILAELKAGGARVVIDSAPLLPVADAQGMLDHPQVDGVLMVGRIMHTTRDDCRRTRAVLDQHRLEPLGVVVTGVEQKEPYDFYGIEPTAGPAPTQLTSEPEGATPR